eukprot:11899382-Alexandrium_andersonii.AAC.1
MSDEEALLRFGLAPLAVRRDIALLGMIHRTILGKGPSQFAAFFRLEGAAGAAAGSDGVDAAVTPASSLVLLLLSCACFCSCFWSCFVPAA